MAEKKKPTLKTHPRVARLNPDDGAPETVRLVGYIGPSKRDGHTRLYLDEGLQSYVELPEDAVHEVVDGEDEAPSRVTVDADTPLDVVRTSRQRTAAGFLAGSISGGRLGRAVRPGGGQICPTLFTARPSHCDGPCPTVFTANPTDCEVCLTVVTANPTDCGGGGGGVGCNQLRTVRPTICDDICLTVVTANPTDCEVCPTVLTAKPSNCAVAAQPVAPVCLTVVTANPTDCVCSPVRTAVPTRCEGPICPTVVTANPTDCSCSPVRTALPTHCEPPICLTVVTANPTDCGIAR